MRTRFDSASFQTPLVHVTGRIFFNYCCDYYIELVLVSFRANKRSCLSLAKAREVLIPVYSSLCPFLHVLHNQSVCTEILIFGQPRARILSIFIKSIKWNH